MGHKDGGAAKEKVEKSDKQKKRKEPKKEPKPKPNKGTGSAGSAGAAVFSSKTSLKTKMTYRVDPQAPSNNNNNNNQPTTQGSKSAKKRTDEKRQRTNQNTCSASGKDRRKNQHHYHHRQHHRQQTTPTIISDSMREVAERNQRQVTMIVTLLDAVRADHVTRYNKDDLDKIQTMIKNIVYREAGELQKLRKLSFTVEQQAVIAQVTGDCDSNPDSTNIISPGQQNQSQGQSYQSKKKPKLSYPYQRLALVATAPSCAHHNRFVKKRDKNRKKK